MGDSGNVGFADTGEYLDGCAYGFGAVGLGDGVGVYAAALVDDGVFVLVGFVEVEQIEPLQNGALYRCADGIDLAVPVAKVDGFGHVAVGGVEERGVAGDSA